MTKEIEFEIELSDGKYKYIRYKEGGQEALRYKEPWRDLVGDNLTYFMGVEIEELQKKLLTSQAQVVQLREALKLIQREHSVTMREVSEVGYSDGMCLKPSLLDAVNSALSSTPPPPVIPKEVADRVKNVLIGLIECGDPHEAGCPCDDTCTCELAKNINEALTAYEQHIK
jgi:hypothetical protein